MCKSILFVGVVIITLDVADSFKKCVSCSSSVDQLQDSIMMELKQRVVYDEDDAKLIKYELKPATEPNFAASDLAIEVQPREKTAQDGAADESSWPLDENERVTPSTFVVLYKKVLEAKAPLLNNQTLQSIAYHEEAPQEDADEVNNLLLSVSTTQNTLGQQITSSIPKYFGDSHSSENQSKNEDEVAESSDTLVQLSDSGIEIYLGEEHGLTVVDLSNENKTKFLNFTNSRVSSFDYHYGKKIKFYTNANAIQSDAGLVARRKADGPLQLAVDWIHDRIYWLSYHQQTVESASLSGIDREILIDHDTLSNVAFPNNIAIDPYDRHMFYVKSHSIYRADLQGYNITELKVATDQNREAKCISLDIQKKRIFFTGKLSNSSGVSHISSCDYGGFNITTYNMGNSTWNDIYGLAFFRDVLYFIHYVSEEESDSLWSLELSTSHTSEGPKKIYSSVKARGGIWSIRVYHPEVQKQPNFTLV